MRLCKASFSLPSPVEPPPLDTRKKVATRDKRHKCRFIFSSVQRRRINSTHELSQNPRKSTNFDFAWISFRCCVLFDNHVSRIFPKKPLGSTSFSKEFSFIAFLKSYTQVKSTPQLMEIPPPRKSFFLKARLAVNKHSCKYFPIFLQRCCRRTTAWIYKVLANINPPKKNEQEEEKIHLNYNCA